jgi:hypothetical protein
MTGRIRAAALCAAVALSRPSLAEAQTGAPRFPAEVTTSVVYQLSSTEDVGTPHAIMCRSRDWRATLRLRFRLKSAGGMVGAEYESVDGTWFAEGSCEGKLTRVHPDGGSCGWSISGQIQGSGSFVAGGESSASLMLYRDGTYQITFLLDGAHTSRSWEGTCGRQSGSGTTPTQLVGSVQDVAYALRGGELVLAPSGERQNRNEHVDGTYRHSWTVGEAVETDDVRLAIDGPGCGCMNAEDAEGPPLRFTARASLPGGTFSRITVVPAGVAPREISSTGGSAPTVVIAATQQTDAVTLRVTYTLDGREHTVERVVNFCALEPVVLASGSEDHTFDDSPEGRLVVDASIGAWFNGQPSYNGLEWKLERIGDGTRLLEPEVSGGSVKFTYLGLPKRNDAFGPRQLEARFRQGECECSRTSRIRTFFRALVSNHPHADAPKGSPYHGMPNWLYYWSQTTAAENVPVSRVRYVEGMDDGNGNAVGARYLDEEDLFLISGSVFHECIPRIDRATRMPTGVVASGIDCFGETMRHENQHRLEWRQWWPSGNALIIFDPDMDGVPSTVEEEMPGCSPYRQNSCHDRPYDLVSDREVHAYWMGWSWPVGKADHEDWSCLGKQWAGARCTSP